MWFGSNSDILEGKFDFIYALEYNYHAYSIYLSYISGDSESRLWHLLMDDVHRIFCNVSLQRC